jgi:hypothetical protein
MTRTAARAVWDHAGDALAWRQPKGLQVYFLDELCQLRVGQWHLFQGVLKDDIRAFRE